MRTGIGNGERDGDMDLGERGMGMDRELYGDRESERNGDRGGDMDRERGMGTGSVCSGRREDSQGLSSVAMGPGVSLSHLSLAGEEKRIREFYQSRGLDRVTQPSGDGGTGGHGGQPAAVLGGVGGTGG